MHSIYRLPLTQELKHATKEGNQCLLTIRHLLKSATSHVPFFFVFTTVLRGRYSPCTFTKKRLKLIEVKWNDQDQRTQNPNIVRIWTQVHLSLNPMLSPYHVLGFFVFLCVFFWGGSRGWPILLFMLCCTDNNIRQEKKKTTLYYSTCAGCCLHTLPMP